MLFMEKDFMIMNDLREKEDKINPDAVYNSDLLNLEQVESIRYLKGDLLFEPSIIYDNSGQITEGSNRKSLTSWIHNKTEDVKWVFELITEEIKRVNREYNFDLLGLENIQYTKYHSPDSLTLADKLNIRTNRKEESGDYFDWHTDMGQHGEARYRKISMIINLSEPESYTGGILQYFKNGSYYDAPQRLGASFSFPSWVTHRVTAMETGVRETLVCWAYGFRPFR